MVGLVKTQLDGQPISGGTGTGGRQGSSLIIICPPPAAQAESQNCRLEIARCSSSWQEPILTVGAVECGAGMWDNIVKGWRGVIIR